MKDPTEIDFPQVGAEPPSYYRGLDSPSRIRTRNVVVFMRDSKTNLQQSRLTNLSHHRHVLIFVVATAGVVSLEGSRRPLRPGDALLVLPYQFHHYMDLEETDLRWLFVTFDLESGNEELETLNQRILRPDPRTVGLLRRTVEVWNAPEEELGRAAEILVTLDQVMLRLTAGLEASGRGDPGAKAVGVSWIARVESLVLRSLREGWSIRQIAEKINVSERHLRTRFRAETGVSLRRYRANIQLHRAIAGMKQAHLSIGQIAELSGFRSQAVFTRFIQRETGRTPSECRRLLHTGALDELFAP